MITKECHMGTSNLGVKAVKHPRDRAIYLGMAVCSVLFLLSFPHASKALTFGYTTAGGSLWSIGALTNDAVRRTGYPVTTTEAGTLNKLTALLSVTSGSETVDVFVAINEQDSVASDSHGEVAGIENVALGLNATPASVDFNASSEAISDATTYIINASGDGTDLVTAASILVNYDLAGSYCYQENSNGGYATVGMEDPWTDTQSISFVPNLSIYATYTAAATDTCTYSDSGDHTFLFSDNCYITSDISVNGTCYLSYDGAGSFGSQANINCVQVVGDPGFEAVFKQGFNFNEY